MSTEQDQMYADIFTTAIEGGVNYWASVSEYRWTLPNSEQDLTGFRAVLQDLEEDAMPHTITRKTIVDGVREMADRYAHPNCDQGMCKRMCIKLVLGRDIDTLDFDAADADMILQAGLFGEVIYG